MERDKILEFVKRLEATDHAIMIYKNPKDRYDVLFTYLKAGLDNGEAVAYVTSQESPEKIKQAMHDFGIDVERYERNGALRVIDYRDWYIIDGKFEASKTVEFWRKLFNESKVTGFKGLRVTGETACFFEHDLVDELVEYERGLHRTLEIPMTAICAYDLEVLLSKGEWFNLLLNLLNTHQTAIMIAGRVGAVSPSQIVIKIPL